MVNGFMLYVNKVLLLFYLVHIISYDHHLVNGNESPHSYREEKAPNACWARKKNCLKYSPYSRQN